MMLHISDNGMERQLIDSVELDSSDIMFKSRLGVDDPEYPPDTMPQLAY